MDAQNDPSKIGKIENTLCLSKLRISLFSFLTILLVASCSSDEADEAATIKPANPFPSTYSPLPSGKFVIEHATVLTGAGRQLDDASILVEDGKIKIVGNNIFVERGTKRFDANGKWVTPGIIDVHSHLGVYSSPSIESTSDGNEMTEPVTAQVWAEHSVWTQDPGMQLALAGGVTTFQVLPGSGNLIGGRGVTLKIRQKNEHRQPAWGMSRAIVPLGLRQPLIVKNGTNTTNP